MIPGGNLLSSALSVIASYTVEYYRFIGVLVNAVGLEISQYAPPQQVRGSLQAVQRVKYQDLGLDMSKFYYTFFAPQQVFGVDRDASGDRIRASDGLYQCVAITPWHAIDGWVEAMLVRVPEDAG
jgi:hypothetical protein